MQLLRLQYYHWLASGPQALAPPRRNITVTNCQHASLAPNGQRSLHELSAAQFACACLVNHSAEHAARSKRAQARNAHAHTAHMQAQQLTPQRVQCNHTTRAPTQACSTSCLGKPAPTCHTCRVWAMERRPRQRATDPKVGPEYIKT